jgi:hypothetical protein
MIRVEKQLGHIGELQEGQSQSWEWGSEAKRPESNNLTIKTSKFISLTVLKACIYVK